MVPDEESNALFQSRLVSSLESSHVKSVFWGSCAFAIVKLQGEMFAGVASSYL